MQFYKLYCNGNQNPLGTGCDILLSWNYQNTGTRNRRQTAFSLRVVCDEEVWESGWIPGGQMQYRLSEAYPVKPGKRITWTVSAQTDDETITSQPQVFETMAAGLEEANWITCGDTEVNAPIFYRDFTLKPGITRARAYITGLGLFVCSCNGSPCTDHLLTPPNTQYDHFCYVKTLDLTKLVQPGENRFSVQLGNGYNPAFSQYGFRYSGKKGLRCLLEFTYEDGQCQRLISDGSWLQHASPILEDGLYRGEVYDARLTQFSPSPAAVDNAASPKGKLLADEMPPIRVIREHIPLQTWDVPAGRVYDFGCNLQGISQIRVDAPRGSRICLRHSERICEDGNLNLTTNRDAAAEDIYICAGTGPETYTPRFTYHGFRYVLVTGLENTRSFAIIARQISADVENGSSFLCSDATINRIHGLCDHSMRCNLVSIPTDCPVRDERTPCQMDSQMVESAMIYNYNMYAFYRKWLRDITHTPHLPWEGNPDWHGDYLMLSYRIYRFMGDLAPFRFWYPRIRGDLEKWMAASTDGVLTTGFGDWCIPNDNTDAGIGACKTSVNTSLLFAYCRIWEEMAGLFGQEEDRLQAKRWQVTIREGFARHCVNADGTILTGRQPDLVLPMYFGLLDGELLARAKQQLTALVTAAGHLDTGGYGTMALIPALTYSGGLDLIPDLLGVGTFPGFGYCLSTGATSLWEQWALDGPMNSHGHALFAGIDAAFYRIFCGVTTVAPGFATFRVEPRLPKSMQFCRCKLQTVSGDISVEVNRLYGGVELSLTVPPNTCATVVLPDWEKAEGCLLFDGQRKLEKKQLWELGSGSYRFRLVPESNLAGALPF